MRRANDWAAPGRTARRASKAGKKRHGRVVEAACRWWTNRKPTRTALRPRARAPRPPGAVRSLPCRVSPAREVSNRPRSGTARARNKDCKNGSGVGLAAADAAAAQRCRIGPPRGSRRRYAQIRPSSLIRILGPAGQCAARLWIAQSYPRESLRSARDTRQVDRAVAAGLFPLVDAARPGGSGAVVRRRSRATKLGASAACFVAPADPLRARARLSSQR
eukprot:scaffold1194_cov369-Prasinococcus_capsulatus_cf.AAC.19